MPLIRSIVNELDHFPSIVVFEPYEIVAFTVPRCLDLRLCLGKVNRLVTYAYVSVLLEVRDGMFRYSLLLPLGVHLLGRFKPAVPDGGLALEFLHDVFHTTRRGAPAISFLSRRACNRLGTKSNILKLFLLHPNHLIVRFKGQDTAIRIGQDDGRYQGRNDHCQRVDHDSCFVSSFLQTITVTVLLQSGECTENTSSS